MTAKEIINPKLVPKNFLKTAPVYPNKAEMSNFNKIKILDKSIGLNIVAIKENLSSGYSLNITRDIKNRPSYITARNNHIKIAYPKPLILLTFDKAILKARATKIKFRNEPTTINNAKSNIAVDLNKPYIKNGIPNPSAKLRVSEIDIPKYCPINILLLLMGCANNNSVNSLEL